jgi:N-acetyl-1-D-myo-inositol-2-amino-2-deoxy-alpha-D-glucopyranoside deacetylase
VTHSRVIVDALTGANASLLIVAPHPDDESLGAGGLIQLALTNGARVTVVLLTDGENNSWPQRVGELRLRITADDRARWGARRRAEARHALAILGVSDTSVEYLGLPDLGLTDRLAASPSDAIAGLRAALDMVRATVVVAPGLDDRHPDHSAAHVMMHLALASCGSEARILSYVVHGSSGMGDAECALDERMLQRKLDAVAAHTSQLILSEKRMLRYANRAERFRLERPGVSQSRDEELRLPWRISRLAASLADLTVVARDRAWIVSVRADGSAPCADMPDCVRRNDGSLWLQLPSALAARGPVFARLSARIRSPWIYDRWGWTAVRAGDER